MSQAHRADRAALAVGPVRGDALLPPTAAFTGLHAFLASCAFLGAAGLLITPATAGCNSGDVAAPALLSSSSCRAGGSADLSLAIGALVTAASGATALGENMTINGRGAIGIGGAPQADGFEALSIGIISQANGDYSIALGLEAGSWGLPAPPGFIAIGATTSANIYSTAIGNGGPGNSGAQATGQYTVAIGGGDDGTRPTAVADNTFGVAMGTAAAAIGVRSTSIGAFAGLGSDPANSRNQSFGEEAGQKVKGAGNTATGLAAGISVTGDLNSALGNSAGVAVTGNNNTAAGVLAGVTVDGSLNVALGSNAGRDLTGDDNIAIGSLAGETITASDTVAIGASAKAHHNQGVAIGYRAVATPAKSVAIGAGSVANVAGTFSVGNASNPRRIVNVATAVNGTDAVNLAQVTALIAAPTAAQHAASRHSRKNTDAELVALRLVVEQLQVQLREQQQRIAQLEGRNAQLASRE